MSLWDDSKRDNSQKKDRIQSKILKWNNAFHQNTLLWLAYDFVMYHLKVKQGPLGVKID